MAKDVSAARTDRNGLHAEDDRAKLTRLWLEAQPAIVALIRGLVYDPDAREDVLQATAEAVSRDFTRYDQARSFTGWAIGVARHRVLAYYRQRQRDQLVFGRDMVDALADAAVRSGTRLSEREMALEACLSALPKHQRRLLEMRYVREMKPMTLAKQLARSPKAVSESLRRLRLALGDCINERMSAGRHG